MAQKIDISDPEQSLLHSDRHSGNFVDDYVPVENVEVIIILKKVYYIQSQWMVFFETFCFQSVALGDTVTKANHDAKQFIKSHRACFQTKIFVIAVKTSDSRWNLSCF